MVSDRSLDSSQRILRWRILHGKLRTGDIPAPDGARARGDMQGQFMPFLPLHSIGTTRYQGSIADAPPCMESHLAES